MPYIGHQIKMCVYGMHVYMWVCRGVMYTCGCVYMCGCVYVRCTSGCVSDGCMHTCECVYVGCICVCLKGGNESIEFNNGCVNYRMQGKCKELLLSPLANLEEIVSSIYHIMPCEQTVLTIMRGLTPLLSQGNVYCPSQSSFIGSI